MGILDYLIPQTMEHQRRMARDRFAAQLAQPEQFQTGEIPISDLLVKNYEKGFGIPYPTAPAPSPSPTAGMAGMTFDPNRQTTVNEPVNMPIEYVKPRTAEDIAMRGAGRQGMAAAEKTLSGLQHYGENMGRVTDFISDAGEDPDEYDLPASLGGFERPQPGPKHFGEKEWDPKTQSWLQRETTTGEYSRIAGAPGDGSGSGSSELDKMYDDALNTYKAIIQKAKIDPAQAMLLNMLPPEKTKPILDGYVSPQLTPDERRQLEQAIQIMDAIQRQRRSGLSLGQLPMEKDQAEAATAESFLKKHLSGEGSTYQTPPFTGPMPKFPQYEIRKK